LTVFAEPVLEVAGTVGLRGGAVEAPVVEVRAVVVFVAVVDVAEAEPTRGLGAVEVMEVGRFGAATFAAPWIVPPSVFSCLAAMAARLSRHPMELNAYRF